MPRRRYREYMADRRAKVLFKVRAEASEQSRVTLLQQLADDGAPARRLFPDEPEGELADMYVVEPKDGSPERMISALEKSDAVEYAEPEPNRRAV